MKYVTALLLCVLLCVKPVYAEPAELKETNEKADGPEITAPSALLMEMSTGTILYEKAADEKRAPASVTKIMTLLLIFEALDSGKIHLEDEVTVSEYAASMGGSQVFLEPSEIQNVDSMIKCISVASANDACVAMAEHICGTEEEFVNQMNRKAKELGMENTLFENCNGLDENGHETTAKDIAIMSRELMMKYPQVQNYCKIWQDTIIHNTKKGSSEFGLSNTNKLIRHYRYATGLKTGSTSKAKFCISATGEKDGIELIAVIMAAENSKERNADAVELLNYGFSKCQKFEEEKVEKTPQVKVRNGKENVVNTAQESSFVYIDTTGADISKIARKVKMQKELKAPVKQGMKAGEVIYYLKDTEIGRVDVLTVTAVQKATYGTSLVKVIREYCL